MDRCGELILSAAIPVENAGDLLVSIWERERGRAMRIFFSVLTITAMAVGLTTLSGTSAFACADHGKTMPEHEYQPLPEPDGGLLLAVAEMPADDHFVVLEEDNRGVASMAGVGVATLLVLGGLTTTWALRRFRV